jgi:hypothetical protein
VSKRKPTAAKFYRRALAAPNAKLGWTEIPDCPMEIFARILGERERAHPETAKPTMEWRARILNEAIYHSKKIASIQPPEWRAEFAWLLALSNTDGTFEADPRSVWAQAYAFGRPDVTCETVAQILDEYERVGLLRRAQDIDGRLWGFWVGSDNFQPPPSKRAHYKQGKRALFGDVVQSLCTPGADKVNTKGTIVQGELDSDFGSVCELELDSDFESELVCAAKSSENEQPEQVKSVREEKLAPRTAEPKPEAFTNRIEYSAACHTAGVQPVSRAVFKKREVLSRDEYEHEKSKAATIDALTVELEAGRRARGYEPCSDDTWRPALDREAYGYTVKRDDGVWCKKPE